MTVNIAGLASGIDVDNLVTGLVAAASQPVRDLDSRRSGIQSASQTLTTFSSKLSSLKTAASALSLSSSVVWTTATSSDSSVAASTGAGALPGSYSVEVTNLASRQKSRSTTFASSTTALGQAGTLAIQFGTNAPTNVTIAAGDTLTQIATKINASGARVTASVIADGAQSRLLVQGLDTGDAAAFTMTETGTTLGVATPASTYQPAANAHFTVDGLPQSSSTNSVGNVIPGMTLALARPTTGPVTITAQTDASQVKTKLQNFVTAYNDVVTSGHAAAGFGGALATNPLLAGDSAIRGAIAHVRSAASDPVTGLTGRYRSLLDLGVSVHDDGTLAFDTAKLDAALASNPLAVQAVLTGSGGAGSMKRVADEIDALASKEGGLVKSRIAAFGTRLKRIDDQKVKLQRQIDDYEAQLRKQFTDMDQVVSKYKAMQGAINSVGNTGTSSGG